MTNILRTGKIHHFYGENSRTFDWAIFHSYIKLSEGIPIQQLKTATRTDPKLLEGWEGWAGATSWKWVIHRIWRWECLVFFGGSRIWQGVPTSGWLSVHIYIHIYIYIYIHTSISKSLSYICMLLFHCISSWIRPGRRVLHSGMSTECQQMV